MRTAQLLPRPTRPARLLFVGSAVLVLSLTACSGGPGEADTTSADGGAVAADAPAPAAREAAGEAPGESPGEAPGDYSSGSGGAKADSAVDLAAVGDPTQQQALIKTGAVAIRSEDVGKTRYDVQVLVDEHGGQIADDKTETDRSGDPLRSRMVLRVPVDDFQDVMDALAAMPTLASTSTSSEDVTTQLIDVEARVKAQQASVQRVRQLLARAASIRDIMSIEAELANRQAQLDSLLQQQAYLADQTSMSTVKVNIERKPDPRKATEKDDDGFLAGLSAGWKGLRTSVVAVATVVGAVLPFALVALVLGVPVWLLVRRVRRTPAAAATPADPAT